MSGVDERPTVRQVYALAAVLCDGAGLAFPRTRGQASTLIERLRIDTRHPAPQLADVRVRPSPGRGRRRRGRRSVTGWEVERRASEVAAELVSEMR
jgi:hypothetical protein